MFDFFKKKKNKKSEVAIELAAALLQERKHRTFECLKKKKGKDKKSETAIEVATALLQVQISLGSAEDNRLTDLYSRGYIFGFCDAMLQSSNIKDEIESMALITIIHLNLFGDDNGATIVGRSFREQGEAVFMKGCMNGGQELVEFLRESKPAMGLAHYLSSGEMEYSDDILKARASWPENRK